MCSNHIGSTMKYCNTSKVTVERTTKEVVYDMVVNKHYAGRWTGSTDIFGIYYETGEHSFFDEVEKKLIGVIIYGYTVARNGVKSISETLENREVLELKRLWVEDGYGSNIESYVIAQSLKQIKNEKPEVKVIISYADPCENHTGIIYKATNWKYQGTKVSHSGNMYQYSFDGEKWLSPRALQAKIGVCGLKDVLKVYPDIQYKLIERKHRYLYFLCNKGEKKRLIKQLKHPLVEYV